ncbi:hypothetical protein TruAng_002048 [Truncatella angustata]|nr:hypothetical protein TruAng_002048 [Truncatella angustata]
MAPPIAKATLSLLLACAAPAQGVETVWSAFAYVLNGERTPFHGPGASHGTLTSIGAQQMYSQGSLFKTRWLTTLSGSESNVTTNAQIANLETSAIDNSQLWISSSRDEFVAAGALAFVQGLYPPSKQSFASNNGGIEAAVLANGSLIDFPLDGYMYPNIRTLSVSESESVWLQGHRTCSNYYRATGSGNLKSNKQIAELYNESYPHYQDLWSTVFDGTFPLAAASFDNAYDLYDFASYQYMHNKTIREVLHEDELFWLSEFASIQQYTTNSARSLSGSEDGDPIRAISGRTLASKVVVQFQQNILTQGDSYKLNLMFGTFEPMLAFFSLSGLSTGRLSGMFQEIPKPGGAIVFELFSEGTDTTNLPDSDDLWVRFLYRNGTDVDAPILEYSLFGNGNSETRIKYRDFVSNIREFSLDDIPTWCEICDAVSIFCSATRQASSQNSSATSSSKNPNMSPVVAGVIGAIMGISLVAVVAVLLFVFGGYNFRRKPAGQKAAVGGFKGAEKMSSDMDLSVAKNGARHERVGSWELGASCRPVATVSKDEPIVGATCMRNIDDDGDSIIMHSEPVKPREGV